MLLLYGNQLAHWLVKDLTARTARKRGVDRWTQDHNRHIGGALRCGLFRNAWLSISLEVRRMVRGLVGIFELGFGSVDLKRDDIRNFFH